jgi:hypothetical protein
MKRLIGLVGLVIIFAGGMYYYAVYKKGLQNPLVQYEKIIKLPTDEQAQAFQKTLKAWIVDPVIKIPYPKGWRKVSVTIDGTSFEVITPDEHEPPEYYASFTFPKKLIPEVAMIKCMGTPKDKKTDICIVGDSPVMRAYLVIVTWIKENSIMSMDDIPAMTIGQ